MDTTYTKVDGPQLLRDIMKRTVGQAERALHQCMVDLERERWLSRQPPNQAHRACRLTWSAHSSSSSSLDPPRGA